ncbi:MAG: (Fe-S)-binding protein [Coriobacteriales bacterium]|nr:(Fe-S)-binding protein [Coriobacteriales bacterium]MBQ6586642.1 (Fe-S)-binding protein [Coriobacteriales bacterium]
MGDMEYTQLVADMCVECMVCVKICDYAKEYVGNPKTFANSYLSGKYVVDQKTPFMCTLCGKCGASCKEKLDLGKMMLELRDKIQAEDLPLPGRVKWVKNTQKFDTGDELFLAKPAPSGNTQRMFFPGCGLAGYSPEMAAEAWKWLNQNDPDCGLLYTCCGAPSRVSGNVEFYEKVVARLKDTMAQYGATQLVVICPDCMEHFRDDAHIDFVSLYEVMVEKGNFPKSGNGEEWMIHDPCKSRSFPEVQAASRKLAEMAGYTVTEPKRKGKRTVCCGQGGLIAYTDAAWAATQSKARADEFVGHDFVTICGACRESLAPYVPGVHLLDLVFNGNLDAAKAKPANGLADKKANQKRTRELLDQV